MKKKPTVDDLSDRIYQVEMRSLDSDDEAFMRNLEDLRVEVGKRDSVRRFEAMRFKDSRGRKYGGIPGQGNGLSSALGGGNFTTDHHGNMLQVKPIGSIKKQVETSVTVSEEQITTKQQKLRNLVREMTMTHTSVAETEKELSLKSFDISKQGSMRRNSTMKMQSQKTTRTQKGEAVQRTATINSHTTNNE